MSSKPGEAIRGMMNDSFSTAEMRDELISLFGGRKQFMSAAFKDYESTTVGSVARQRMMTFFLGIIEKAEKLSPPTKPGDYDDEMLENEARRLMQKAGISNGA